MTRKPRILSSLIREQDRLANLAADLANVAADRDSAKLARAAADVMRVVERLHTAAEAAAEELE
jgi:hypothetical protein